MQIHELKRKTASKTKKIVGRGGKRGTTSGRGTKGQSSRAGHKLRPEFRDIIKKLPKLRGYRVSGISKTNMPVNLDAIEKTFEAGAVISPSTLLASGLVSKKSGQVPVIKILGNGVLTKAVTVFGCAVSVIAKEKITKAGGTVK
jgi:large subunit ribosomal protein L15